MIMKIRPSRTRGGLWIWGTAAIVYALFISWYFNWSGPLTETEIEESLATLAEQRDVPESRLKMLRKFLEEDDGDEFLMQNLIRFNSGNIVHPSTGQPASAYEVLDSYNRPFISALFRRAGHPVIVSNKVGGYIEAWNLDAATDWELVASMRYRSRRDMIELVLDPQFEDIHEFKTAALQQTGAFPVHTQMSLYLTPKIYVPILILLFATITHLFSKILSPRKDKLQNQPK